jgi:hypothetical protein
VESLQREIVVSCTPVPFISTASPRSIWSNGPAGNGMDETMSRRWCRQALRWL